MRTLQSLFFAACACVSSAACERKPAANTPEIAALPPGASAEASMDAAKAESIRVAIKKANAESEKAAQEQRLRVEKAGGTPVPVGDVPAIQTSERLKDQTPMEHADRMRTLGSPDAKVWMVMVSDFQCPWCAKFERETWPAIRDEYVFPGKIRVAFLNFPMPAHRNAFTAAEVVMCGASQPTGKFWPLHDNVFREQERWESESDPMPVLLKQVEKAAMFPDSVAQCVKTHAMRPLIQGDIDRATRAGAASTPTFFIGGTPLVGAAPVSEFRRAIDAALAKVEK
jgi:protein-disulfide isomerase